MKVEINIYENMPVREAIKKILEDGYMPATLKEVWNLRKEKRIPYNGYGTRTLFLEGEIKDATIEQLKNIEEIYRNDGRLFHVDDHGNIRLICYYDLGLCPRFVGVRVENTAQKISNPSLEQRV